MNTYRNAGINSAVDSAAITPSDTTSLNFDALYVGGAGTVVIKHNDAAAPVTFGAVPAGAILPVKGVRVLATGTTATNIVAMAHQGKVA